MSDEQLEEWSGLLAMEVERVVALKRFYEYYYGANEAWLRGATSEEEMIQAMYHARRTIPDDFGTGKAGAAK